MFDKLTKIVATIGPATETEETLVKLIDAGMNVARFNTKHSSPQWHQERIERVKKVAKEKNASVGVLLDLQGPEIRINLPEEKPFDLTEGEICTFTFDEKNQAVKKVLIPQNVVETLQVGNMVLLDDGACELEVVEKEDSYLILKALSACTVKHRKTLNVPGITIDMPALVETDYLQLDGAKDSQLIDFVGLSFVRNSEDIEFLRQELNKRNIKAQIVAKIETQAALDNLDEIVAASDVVMIARGDLGVEVPYEELTFWQKKIIKLCHDQAKPVITATQMLKSMTDNPRPTRAEVSDVAHAIYDGTDAVMLSEETTIGRYPVKAVRTQATIAEFNEKYANDDLEIFMTDDEEVAITNAAVELAETSGLQIDKLICFTTTGHSARLLGRLHPSMPILAVAYDPVVYYNLSLVYGVIPVLMKKELLADFAKVIEELKKLKLLTEGEKVVVAHGLPYQPGGVDILSIVTVKK